VVVDPTSSSQTPVEKTASRCVCVCVCVFVHMHVFTKLIHMCE